MTTGTRSSPKTSTISSSATCSNDKARWVNDPTGNQTRVRAVEVLLVARTAFEQRGYRDTSSVPFGDYTIPAPNDAYRRKTLNSLVKTRNVGL